MGIPVLMYHALEDARHPAGARDLGEQRYVLTVQAFREQMRLLKERGLRTVLLGDLEGLSPPPGDALVLTFDDGHESNCALALPILQEFGFVAHFFITTGWIGTPHYMSPAQLRQLADAGMALGTHGVSHRFFDSLSQDELECELRDSRATLSALLGRSVTELAAPGGRVGPELARVASRLGYRRVCTSRVGTFTPGGSWLAIPRLALRSDTGLDVFARLISAERGYLQRLRLKAALLGAAKQLLGNEGYTKVRGKLLDRLGRAQTPP